MTTLGNRILIIDDDTRFADTVASYLTARQFTVFRAETGQEGIRLASVERPDLILMDIILGERTEGSSTIQEIRRNEGLRAIPIFILSSNCANLPDLQTAGTGWLPHDSFLQKPVNLGQLLDKIHHTLARSHEHVLAGHCETASVAAAPGGQNEDMPTARAGNREAG